MAKFRCKCGKLLSNSEAPNNVQLKIYTDKEWDNIINMGNLIDPLDIPDPRYDVWRCINCKRIHFFDGNDLYKTYVLEI